MKPLILLLACSLLFGCDVQDQSMWKQKKYSTYAPSDQWPDGASARPLPAHAISLEDAASASPPTITSALIEQGRQRYEILCTPCHGYDGGGRGMAVMRGFPQPPSYHTDRLRNTSARHIFDVISNGYGVMYSYRDRVTKRDRWAIIAYIRALQLSQLSASIAQPDQRP